MDIRDRWIDVKSEGAVGDGSTDDTTAIQAALDAVSTTTGGMVFFPPGRYRVTSTLVVRRHRTTLAGVGPGHWATNATHTQSGSRLEAGGTLSGGPLLRVQDTGNTQPVFGTTLRDLTLDGMGTATGPGIHWRSYRSVIDNVHVYRFATHGIHFEGYGSWGLYETDARLIEVAECGGSGVYIGTGSADLHFIHPVIFDCGVNMRVESSSAQVTGAHLYNATTNNLLFNGNGSRSKFANCKIEGAEQHGVVIDTTNGGISDIQFTGCNFSQNGEGANNTYDQIHVTGPSGVACSRPVLTGCVITHKSGNLPRYGLNLGSNVQGGVVVGNTFGGSGHYGTAAILNNSSGSNPAVVANNHGV